MPFHLHKIVVAAVLVSTASASLINEKKTLLHEKVGGRSQFGPNFFANMNAHLAANGAAPAVVQPTVVAAPEATDDYVTRHNNAHQLALTQYKVAAPGLFMFRVVNGARAQLGLPPLSRAEHNAARLAHADSLRRL